MNIKIISEYEDKKRGRVKVIMVIDGKEKYWDMSKGLWEFVQKLIKS